MVCLYESALPAPKRENARSWESARIRVIFSKQHFFDAKTAPNMVETCHETSREKSGDLSKTKCRTFMSRAQWWDRPKSCQRFVCLRAIGETQLLGELLHC
mmetsp:Transcript_54193/g.110573  ORF Transcript_54193/g.110573 Transcript_54193/m.110573 type:complete len:101 (+) Transcript_54193:63-365(+)